MLSVIQFCPTFSSIGRMVFDYSQEYGIQIFLEHSDFWQYFGMCFSYLFVENQVMNFPGYLLDFQPMCWCSCGPCFPWGHPSFSAQPTGSPGQQRPMLSPLLIGSHILLIYDSMHVTQVTVKPQSSAVAQLLEFSCFSTSREAENPFSPCPNTSYVSWLQHTYIYIW